MKLINLLISIVFLSIIDYIYINRKKVFLFNKKIHLSGIIPRGWKQNICFAMIPLSMISVAVMFTLFYKMETIYILKRLCLVAILWPVAISDFKELRIPNKLIIYGIVLRLLLLITELIFSFNSILDVIKNEGIAAIGAVIVCVICMILSRGSLGMGDLKLIILMALFLGIEGICYSMFISIFISFVFAIILLILKKKTRKDVIPFAPFILTGTFVSLILTGV